MENPEDDQMLRLLWPALRARPQVRNQAFCPSPDCQRARKRQWQCDKLKSDPTYRINQRAAQQAWSQPIKTTGATSASRT